ncbi:MAG: hypothetical protein H0V01_03510 [Bacteroidetes bacterium]|nr:hypothetical protein [Bacteroidota bacterium]HET6245545.1 hypothetical protein [Bacteroidia bacterium]
MKLNIFKCLLILIAAATITITGCRRPAKPEAIITITTVDKKPVSGATVFLHANDATKPGDYEYTLTTNGAGQAHFKFDLEAIYTIDAKKDSLFGQGTVRLIMDEVVKQTVIVY